MSRFVKINFGIDFDVAIVLFLKDILNTNNYAKTLFYLYFVWNLAKKTEFGSVFDIFLSD